MRDQSEPVRLIQAVDRVLDEQPLNAKKYLIILACLAVMTLDGLDFQLLAFAAPLLAKDLGIGKVELAGALGVTLVGMTLGAPFGGWMGDKWGPRRSLVIAAFAFGITTLLMTWTSHIWEIVVLRLISGFGFGAAIPNGMALAGIWSGSRRRGPVIALLTLGTPIGAVLGGILSAWLMPQFGWRIPFLFSGGLTLGLAVATLILLPESPMFLALKGREGQAWRLLSRVSNAQAQPAGSIAPEPAVQTAGAPPPLLSRPTLRTNLTLWTAFFGLACAAYAYFNWFPTVFVDAGFSLVEAIRDTSIFSFVSIGGSLLITLFLAHRMHARRIILPFLVGALAATGLLALALLGFDGSYVSLLMGLAGLCISASQTSLYVLASSSFPPSQRARAIGICVGFSRLGGICIVFGGGAFLSIGGIGSFFAAMGFMLAVTILALILYRRPGPGDAAQGARSAQPEQSAALAE